MDYSEHLAETKQMSKRYSVGQRVELSPSTDRWMRGDRYGEVTKIGRLYVHVKLDQSEQTLPFDPRHLTAI